MWKLLRSVIVAMAGVGGALALLAVLASFDVVSLAFSETAPATPAAAGAETEPAPPEGQTYTGAKRCSSCHFEQYMSWKKTKHAKEAFEVVPAKYRSDAKCMKCHATGVGAATGYKTAADENLAGTTCEACHGPGSEHEKVAKQFAEKKKLTPAEEKVARDSIYKMLPKNVCLECHSVQAHKKSETPPELIKKK